MRFSDALKTDELARRPSRPPDFEAENRAMVALARELAGNPDNLFQELVHAVVALCHADTAAVSVLDREGTTARDANTDVYSCVAVGGAPIPDLEAAIPRDLGAGATLLTQESALLIDRPGRYFVEFAAADPPVVEGLLQPLHVAGQPVGAIWALIHGDGPRFDAEDARLLGSLSQFTAAGYQAAERARALTRANASLRESEARFRTMMEQSPLSMQIFDLQGWTLAVNPAWEALWGASRAWVADYNILADRQLQSSGLGPKVRSAFAGELVHLPETWYEPREIDKPGRGRWIEGYLYPLRTPDRTTFDVALVHNDVTERKQAEDALRKSEHHLRDLSRSLERRVVERTKALEHQSARLRSLVTELATAEHRERKRIAALIHDDLQQWLVAARMQLGHVRGHVDDETAAEAVTRAQRLLDEAGTASRNLTRQLRPPVLYEDGLVAALKWLATETERRHGLRVTVEAGAPVDLALDDDLRAMLYESVRELLFNAAKYANVDEAAVAIGQHDGRLRLLVSDGGRGFDPAALARSDHQGAFGLFSIRERLSALGGEMTIDAAEGTGTRIELTAPLAAIRADRSARPEPEN